MYPIRDGYQHGERKTGDELRRPFPPEKHDCCTEGEEAPA